MKFIIRNYDFEKFALYFYNIKMQHVSGICTAPYLVYLLFMFIFNKDKKQWSLNFNNFLLVS